MTSYSNRNYENSYGKHKNDNYTYSDAETHHEHDTVRKGKNHKSGNRSSSGEGYDNRKNSKDYNGRSKSRDKNYNRDRSQDSRKDRNDDNHARGEKKNRTSGGYMNKRGNQGEGNTYDKKHNDKDYKNKRESYETPRKNNSRRRNNETSDSRSKSRSQKDRRDSSDNYDSTDRRSKGYKRNDSKNRNYERKSYPVINKGNYSLSIFSQHYDGADSYSKKNKRSSNYDEIDDSLMDINLKKPQTSYNFFIKAMMDKEGSGDLIETSQHYSKQWRNMKDEEKQEYEEMAKEDQERYNKEMELVRKHLFSNQSLKGINHGKMAYLEECAIKAIMEGKDIREAREKGRSTFKSMKDSDRDRYHDVHRNKGYEINPNRINSYNLFVKAQIEKARNKGKTLTLAEVPEIWNRTDDKTRALYEEAVEVIKEETSKYRNNIELVSGVKPRRPLGAYKIFMVDMARQGKFDGDKNVFAETSRLWEKCSDEEKERYQKMAHREKLEYMVKKSEFIQNMRRTYGKARTAYNLFTHDMKDKIADMDFKQGEVFEYLYDQWCKCDDKTKQKYEEMAEREKEESEQRREELKESLNPTHRRTPNAYAIFVRERASDRKKEEGDNAYMNGVFRALGEEWKGMNDKEKEKYYDMYEQELDEDGNRNRHFHNRSHLRDEDDRRTSHSQYSKSNKRSKNDSSSNKSSTQQYNRRDNRL